MQRPVQPPPAIVPESPRPEGAPAPAQPTGGLEPARGGELYGASLGAGTAVPVNSQLGSLSAYIDSAIPRSRVRVRYDAAWFINSPYRAEFFWSQNGPFRAAGQPVSYQEQSTYVEYAPLPNMSAFIDVPTRFLHIPGVFGRQYSQNFSGLSDLQLGAKYAFLTDPNYFYTFVLRTYLPTGNGATGLGTAHASLEPGLLAFQRLSERLYFIGEFTEWIPLHGSVVSGTPGQPFAGRHFAGNTLTYGGGLIYNLVLTDRFRLAPTTEVVGWTVLGGLEEIGSAERLQSAAGDTIVNIKIGATLGLGDYLRPGGATPLNDRLSLYAGYSRSLTSDVWARDMFRLELVWYYGQRRRRPG